MVFFLVVFFFGLYVIMFEAVVTVLDWVIGSESGFIAFSNLSLVKCFLILDSRFLVEQ